MAIELATAYNERSGTMYMVSTYLGRELEALSCAPTADGRYTVIQFVTGPCRIVRNRTITPLTPEQRRANMRTRIVDAQIRRELELANGTYVQPEAVEPQW